MGDAVISTVHSVSISFFDFLVLNPKQLPLIKVDSNMNAI
jgi:hypothetical protein